MKRGTKVIAKIHGGLSRIHGVVKHIEEHVDCNERECTTSKWAVIDGTQTTDIRIGKLSQATLELEEKVVEDVLVPISELEVIQ